jgi:hypothetical protein
MLASRLALRSRAGKAVEAASLYGGRPSRSIVAVIMGRGRLIRVVVELEATAEPIRGAVESEAGRRPFEGWIELAAALEGARGATTSPLGGTGVPSAGPGA